MPCNCHSGTHLALLRHATLWPDTELHLKGVDQTGYIQGPCEFTDSVWSLSRVQSTRQLIAEHLAPLVPARPAGVGRGLEFFSTQPSTALPAQPGGRQTGPRQSCGSGTAPGWPTPSRPGQPGTRATARTAMCTAPRGRAGLQHVVGAQLVSATHLSDHHLVALQLLALPQPPAGEGLGMPRVRMNFSKHPDLHRAMQCAWMACGRACLWPGCRPLAPTAA